MTIDEAIRHCEEVAERYETRAKMIDRRKLGFALENPTACHECAADHRQLAEWLTELLRRRERCAQYEVEQISNLEQYDMLSREYEILNERYKEAIRLLRLAVDDIARTESCFLCKYYDKPAESCQTTDDCFVWRYADEALALIGEDGDAE